MINLKEILNPKPQTNNVRRLNWSWRYFQHFGYFPNSTISQCRICKSSVWTNRNTDPFDQTCSDKCAEGLEDLRAENHWN